MSVVVGTAGHIDHGKTALLRALTGIDADRLPEEQRRGMTIDVGYAHAELAGVPVLDFVDVPGHDRLIGNMLVGAGEIDAALLVVAADDGPRPQTLEHLELLDALGIGVGIAAVTKADLATPERIAEVGGAVRELLDRTAMAGAPVIVVSTVGASGIEELRAALGLLAGRAEVARTQGPGPRLAIDRVFAVRGRGVVVTGSLRDGRIGTGDWLVAMPGDREVRVREVQVHGAAVEVAGPGRVALNLAAIDRGFLHRGTVLARPGLLSTTDRLLVAVRPPARLRADVPGPAALPADRARLRLHVGTDQVAARIGRSGRASAQLDGERATAILRLDRPVAVAVGDRFVLRRPSPGSTAGGGIVLDPAPPRGISRRRLSPERLVALDRATAAGDMAALAAAQLVLHGAIPQGGHVALAEDVRDGVRGAVMEATENAPGTIPLAQARAAAVQWLRRAVSLDTESTAAAAVVDGLIADGSIERHGDRVAQPGVPTGPSPAEQVAAERLVAALDVAAPLGLREAVRAAGCPPDVLRALERAGRIVRVDEDLAWSAPAWERLARQAVALATVAPLTPAALRDVTGTSRRYVMALLEDLNRRGILVRGEAGHRPGPRAATLRDRDSVA